MEKKKISIQKVVLFIALISFLVIGIKGGLAAPSNVFDIEIDHPINGTTYYEKDINLDYTVTLEGHYIEGTHAICYYSLDGTDYVNIVNCSSITLTNLSLGNHNVIVKAVLNNGSEGIISVEEGLIIENSRDNGNEDSQWIGDWDGIHNINGDDIPIIPVPEESVSDTVSFNISEVPEDPDEPNGNGGGSSNNDEDDEDNPYDCRTDNQCTLRHGDGWYCDKEGNNTYGNCKEGVEPVEEETTVEPPKEKESTLEPIEDKGVGWIAYIIVGLVAIILIGLWMWNRSREDVL